MKLEELVDNFVVILVTWGQMSGLKDAERFIHSTRAGSAGAPHPSASATRSAGGSGQDPGPCRAYCMLQEKGLR